LLVSGHVQCICEDAALVSLIERTESFAVSLAYQPD